MPTASDDVFFDSASGAVTITLGVTGAAKTFTCTGFSGTFAMSTFGLTVSGSVVLSATMGLTGTSATGINIAVTGSSLTTNGLVVGIAIALTASITVTLVDNLTLNGGTLRQTVSVLNGNSVIFQDNSNFYFVGTGTCSGTTNFSITGNNISFGAFTVASTMGISNNITINTAGTVTLRADSQGAFGLGTSNFTYLAGTVVFIATFIRLVATGTVTFNLGNLVIPALTAAVGGVIINPAQDINITGTINLSTTSQISAGNVFATSLTMSGVMTASAGVLTLNGTGIWSGSSSFKNNLIINTSGTLTISGSVGFETGTLTYMAGAVTTTGSTLSLILGCTLNTGGMSWNSITMFNPTVTITSDLNLNGTLTISNTTVTINGLFNINTKSLTMTTASSGTASIVLNGTGTWSGSGAIGNNLTINSGGIVTISGSVNFGASGKTLTYTAGTVVTTGSTLNNNTACTLNTAGISWNNFTANIQGTITNNSLLTISGTLTYASTAVGVTFGGTAGWICGTFTCTVANIQHAFTVGNTYTITSAFTITAATNAARITLVSSSAGTKVRFILSLGATQNVGFVNATDLDSNAGQTIYSFNGVITTTFNWQTLTYPRQSSFVFQH